MTVTMNHQITNISSLKYIEAITTAVIVIGRKIVKIKYQIFTNAP